MCEQLQTAIVSFNIRRQPHTVTGLTPAANGALQTAPEVGALWRQRERSDRIGTREGRREVQEGQVVEHCGGGVVAGMHQHVARLRAAIGRWVGECQLCVCERESDFFQVGAGTNMHTLRVCIVEGVVSRSIWPAVTITWRSGKNTGPSVRQWAAVTTNEGLTIVPPHR